MSFSTHKSELRQHKRAIGVLSSLREAESTLTSLRDAGFNMNKVSVFAKDSEGKGDIADVAKPQPLSHQADERAAQGAIAGATMGGITGLIVGFGTLAIPGVGPIFLIGEVVTTLAAAAAGAGIGAAAGGFLGALMDLGIPEERAKVYDQRVSSGDYMVIVDGTDEEVHRAKSIMITQGIQEFAIYHAPQNPQ